MKTSKFNLLLSLLLLVVVNSCEKEDETETDPSIYGKITVDLDANKSTLRSQEAKLGNLVCDAFKEYAVDKGNDIDFAISNGGAIRFDGEVRKNGIYPAGDVNAEIINEIFPWPGSIMTIVEVTGEELKSIFEWSVSSLPEENNGWFLQVSDGIKVEVDLSKPAQLIDEITDPDNPTIKTQGERIVSIKINDTEYSSAGTYKLVTYQWTTKGNDNFITFKNIPDDRKTDITDDRGEDQDRYAFEDYIKKHTPVTPAIEGRITFN